MRTSFAVLALSLLAAGSAFAADAAKDPYVITLKDHVFAPATLTVPANQKIELTVKNEQSTTAEFESSDFDREKVIAANDSIKVFIGPLKPGNYKYFDDFHEESTGVIVAK